MLGIFGALPFSLALQAVYLPAAIGWFYGFLRGQEAAQRGVVIALGSFCAALALSLYHHVDGRALLILLPLALGLAGPAFMRRWQLALALSIGAAFVAASTGMIFVVTADCLFSANACL